PSIGHGLHGDAFTALGAHVEPRVEVVRTRFHEVAGQLQRDVHRVDVARGQDTTGLGRGGGRRQGAEQEQQGGGGPNNRYRKGHDGGGGRASYLRTGSGQGGGP